MSAGHALVIFLAGVGAGTINTIVGSGTLITFPVLLALGYPPVVANTSNNVGLVPGSASGTWGYRAELAGQGRRMLRFGTSAVAGAGIGAALLLTLSPGAFRAIVPVFIAIALVLIVLQPRLARWASTRGEGRPPGGAPLTAGVFAAGVYGGYFGAAQGILLLALFGVLLDEPLQRANALKNLLAGLNNATAAVVFIGFAHLAWGVVGLIAAGSVIGGQLGSRAGRRLPDRGLRAVIVAVGVFAIVRLAAG